MPRNLDEEIRRVLAGWTLPDNVFSVPLCGALSDSQSAALHMIVTPSEDFPTPQEASDAVPNDEPLHKVLIRLGVHELQATLFLRIPVLLEVEGRWQTTLGANGVPMLRFEDEGAKSAMARNLHIECGDESSRARRGLGSAASQFLLRDADHQSDLLPSTFPSTAPMIELLLSHAQFSIDVVAASGEASPVSRSFLSALEIRGTAVRRECRLQIHVSRQTNQVFAAQPGWRCTSTVCAR